MKKRLALFLALLCMVSLAACGGNTDMAMIDLDDSALYSKKELLDAVDVVMDSFQQKGYQDCTLLNVEYDEAFSLERASGWAERYGADEVVILLTDIYVGLNATAVGPMNPGKTCSNYQWILSRSNGGRWTLQDRGYG